MGSWRIKSKWLQVTSCKVQDKTKNTKSA